MGEKIINIKYILFSLYVLVLTFQEIFDLPAILYSIQILTFSEILELSPIIYKFFKKYLSYLLPSFYASFICD